MSLPAASVETRCKWGREGMMCNGRAVFHEGTQLSPAQVAVTWLLLEMEQHRVRELHRKFAVSLATLCNVWSP